MKKSLVSIIICLMMVVSLLAGCGKKVPSTNNDSTNAQQENKEDATEDSSDEENKDDETDIEEEQEEEGRNFAVYKTYEYDNEWNNDIQNSIAKMEYHQFFFDENVKAKYPALVSSIEEFNACLKDSAEYEYKQCVENAKEMYDSGDFYDALYTKRDLYVRRADDRVFSFLSSYSGYAGGAHGYDMLGGYNYDTKTGKELELKDVVTDLQEVYDLIATLVPMYYPDIDLLSDVRETLIDPVGGDNFIIDPEGITYIFNPYDIAAYCYGAQYIQIPYEKYKELLKAEYFEGITSYVMQLPEGYGERLDFEHTGELMQFGYWKKQCDWDEGEYDGFTFFNDNASIEPGENFDFFSEDSYILKTEGGEYYLMIFQRSYNDWVYVNVFEMASGFYRGVYNEDYGIQGLPYGEYNWAYGIITDIDKMMLNRRTDMLSTGTCYAPFHLNDKGYLVQDSDRYLMQYQFELTLKQDLEVETVDDNGYATGKATLKAGEKVKWIATDDKTYADIETQDGKVYRVMIKYGTYPVTIKGVDVMDIFDGIVYAG